ncbi:MAG: adenylosuccinate lyase, partial [Candidatus Aenigmatarchaeota archaeon]
FDLNSEMVIAEPIYIILAAHNHPDAHEYVKQLTLKSQKTGKLLLDLLFEDPEAKPYLAKLTKAQKDILTNPEKYTGIASKKAESVCSFWEKKLSL